MISKLIFGHVVACCAPASESVARLAASVGCFPGFSQTRRGQASDRREAVNRVGSIANTAGRTRNATQRLGQATLNETLPKLRLAAAGSLVAER